MLRLGMVPLSPVLALLLGAQVGSAQVDLKAEGTDRVEITINGQLFSTFYIGPEYPKPFLAPLRTASGLVVTRKFPMEKVEGETSDHPHHRGLFLGYGNVGEVNFWETEPGTKSSAGNPPAKGLIVLKQLGAVTPGKKSGSLSATFTWRAEGHGDMIEESRVMTFYADPSMRTVDVDATLTAQSDIRFSDTKEGFFAIRVADSMTEKNGGIMTNSEGQQTEKNVWGKRADWVDYDGVVEGQKVGIVVFDSPQNFNHPPRWHSRAYGLFAVNPFGLKDFDPKATGTGGTTLKAGESLRFRYRVVIHPGDVPKKKIETWYGDYAKKR